MNRNKRRIWHPREEAREHCGSTSGDFDLINPMLSTSEASDGL
jgi:hypothetical protein